MRLLTPLLLALVLCLRLAADEQPEATPSERLTSHIKQLQDAGIQLRNGCSASALAFDPALLALIDSRCAEAGALLERVKHGAVTDPEVTIVEGRLQRVGEAAVALAGLLQATDPKTVGEQYKHVAGTPELSALQAFAKDTVATLMKTLAAQGQLEPSATQGMENERQRRDLRLKLVDAGRDAAEEMKDTPGWSAPTAFTAGVAKVQELLALAQLPANPDPAKLQELQDKAQARIEVGKVLVGYLMDLLHGDVLAHGWATPKERLAPLWPAEQAVAAAGTAAAAALGKGLATVFAELAELKPAGGALERFNQAHEVVLTPLHEACDRAEETWDMLTQAEDSGKETGEQIARCTSAPQELHKRLGQALEAIAAGARARAAAAAAGDRVASFEAKGELSLGQVALERLHEEAETEADLDAAGPPWKGREQEPAVSEPLKRYLAQRDKLRAAQAVVLADALTAERLRARLELLEFKKQLQDTAAQGHTQERDTAKDAIEALTQALGDVLQGGPATRERDAKDAGRIPLTKPGDEKF